MCRTGKRHCTYQSDLHRERYNARRRIVRNSEKASVARADGREADAAMYEGLAATAMARDAELEQQIAEHGTDSVATEPEVRESGLGDSVDDGTEYRMEHKAPYDDSADEDGYYQNLTDIQQAFPDVMRTPSLYDGGDDRETMRHVKAVANNPNAMVTIYRAVPPGVTAINKGDWVTLSREYAEFHSKGLESSGDGVIIKASVPASQVWTDGNSLAEFGYDGPHHIETAPSGRDPHGDHPAVATPPAAPVAVAPAVATSEPSAVNAAAQCPECGRFTSSGHVCPGPKREALDSWRESLSATEKDAWDTYGSIEHEDINRVLRDAHGDDAAVMAALSEDQRVTVAGLDSALARAPRSDEPYEVYRAMSTARVDGDGNVSGQDGVRWAMQNAEPGTTITLDGYTSTSTDPTQMGYFAGANSEYTHSGVQFKIETTQGGNWGAAGPEKEVTLARGTKFEVLSVDYTQDLNGKPYPLVSLREVAPLASGADQRPDWAAGEFISTTGETYYYDRSVEGRVNIKTSAGKTAGFAEMEGGKVSKVTLRPRFEGQGIERDVTRFATGE